MRGFLHTICFTLLLASIAAIGILVGYRAVIDRETVSFVEDSAVFANAHVPAFAPEIYEEPDVEISSYMEKFMPGAIIRFEHYHLNGSTADTWEMEIPQALVGRTSNYLQTVFPMWSIERYDASGATLRRAVPPTPTQVYLVSSTQDGFVVVFFDDEIAGTRLKEVTSITVNGLPEIEKERLQTGVLVRGEHSLMRLLEDLGS